jgi:hypothetical protein
MAFCLKIDNMIWESEHWKKPLLHLASKLVRWRKPREWTERELVSIEKDIFVAFYSIRKLMDAKKLSDGTETMPVNVSIYLSKDKAVTIYNWDKIDELYDLEVKNLSQRNLRFICNQIIHSYVFIPSIDENGSFQAILFCSDREKNANLFRIEANDLINALRIVGKDYPVTSVSVFNPNKQDYDVTNG